MHSMEILQLFPIQFFNKNLNFGLKIMFVQLLPFQTNSAENLQPFAQIWKSTYWKSFRKIAHGVTLIFPP